MKQTVLVDPVSILPKITAPTLLLWGEKDASGKPIDYAAWRTAYNEYRDGKTIYAPEVPAYAPNSNIRYLIDFVLSLK